MQAISRRNRELAATVTFLRTLISEPAVAPTSSNNIGKTLRRKLKVTIVPQTNLQEHECFSTLYPGVLRGLGIKIIFVIVRNSPFSLYSNH